MRSKELVAIGRTAVALILVIVIIVAAAGVGYLTTTTRTGSSTTTTSSSTISWTISPSTQECNSSSSQTNLNWTQVINIPNSFSMHLLVLAVNSTGPATLCVQYTKNPSPDASGLSQVNLSASILAQASTGNGWICCTPNVSISAQPSQLNFGNGSAQKFFVRYTITVSTNAGSYDVLGVSGLCQFAGLMVNENLSSSGLIKSVYSNTYSPSCGFVIGAVGQLVSAGGVSYGYINESNV